jgi:hypothetical protein
VVYAGSNANPASYVGADPNRLFNTVGVVYKSTDGGRSWVELATGLGRGTRVTNIRINPANPAIVYASTFGLASGGGSNYLDTQFGVLKSVNGGATWTSMKTGLGPGLGQQAIMKFDPSDPTGARIVGLSQSGTHVVEVVQTVGRLLQVGRRPSLGYRMHPPRAPESSLTTKRAVFLIPYGH